MKKTDLMKPGSARANDLLKLSRAMNKREDTIEQLRQAHRATGNTLVTECILQGGDLLKTKSYLAHGQWLDWLASHCPGISVRRAQLYMRVAANAQHVSHIWDASSLREALFLCAEETAKETKKAGETAKPTKSFPAWSEGRNKLAKAIDYVQKNCPVEKMPEDLKVLYRELLEPFAKALWPEKWLILMKAANGE